MNEGTLVFSRIESNLQSPNCRMPWASGEESIDQKLAEVNVR